MRSAVGGLPKLAGLFLFPSLEAALIEVSLLVTERERELGGERTTIPYGHLQDPALDRMAKVLSSTGLDTRAKKDGELAQAAAWFPEMKPKTLLAAWAEDDRFTGRVHDVGPLRAVFFADGLRIPVISVNSGSLDWRSTLPKPFEIRIYEVRLPASSGASRASDQFATIVMAGERLRLEPRLAPLSMDSAKLSRIEKLLLETQSFSDQPNVRSEIENFEAALPTPFRAWWSVGENRRLDRVILTSSEHDGSFVIERLKTELVKTGISPSLFDAGVFSLSGCVMEDARRQEWLRSRGEDAWAIRGSIHISLELIRAIPRAGWQTALSSVTKS